MNTHVNHDEMENDPRLNALLDEALAPASPPEELADRIVAASLPHLRQARPSTLARIGPVTAVLATAAALAIAAGVWFASPANAPSQAQPTLASLSAELDALARAEREGSAPIDQQIEMLALQVDLTRSDRFWPGDDALDDIDAEVERELLVAEPYFVF